jgi:hypothetical protein
MEQHEMPVRSFPQIDFDKVGMAGSGFPNGRQSVFGGMTARTPVTDAEEGCDDDLH